MADSDDYLYCDKKECNLGESITFKLLYPLTYNLGMLSHGREGINVYEDNVLIDSNVKMDSDGYFYTPSTSGTHTIKIEGYNYITVEITVTGGDSGVTWTIGNKQVKSLTINNKEVKSILRTSDNTILYEQAQEQIPLVEFIFTGTTLTQYSSASNPLIGENVVIDYGDGTIGTGNNFGHTYTDGLTEHTITIKGVTGLGTSCFRGITGLTSITIPDSVTSIGASCFDSCTGLTSINILNSVASFGNYCFYGCTGLTSITIPDSVTSIGASCFARCSGLTSITIPDSVTSIGGSCFSRCTGIVSVTLNWTNPTITYNNSRLSGCTNLATIYIPNGTTSLYTAKNYPSAKLVEMQ